MTLKIEQTYSGNGNEGAFPAQFWTDENNDSFSPLEYQEGMTKREFMASMIMASMVKYTANNKLAATVAVQATDALLAALATPKSS